MTEPDRPLRSTAPRGEPPRPTVASCAQGLAVARARLHAGRRHAPPGGNDERRLQADLLAALEAYGAAIADAGAPLPYRVRDEINLYRGILRPR